MNIKNIKGITLTELVVVMAVISVLASVSMPLYKVSAKRVREIELKRALWTMRDAIDTYKRYVDAGRISKEAGGAGYPKDLETLTKPAELVNTPITPGQQQTVPKVRFLRRIPTDPMTGKAEWGQRSNADEPDSSVWGGNDVYDVYSLSDGTALDGTEYKDW